MNHPTDAAQIEREEKRQAELKKMKYTGYFHRAVRVRDMEAKRHFYEDIIGLPFAACAESDHDHTTGLPTHYIHTFFSLPYGTDLAFFQFDDDRYPYIERSPSYLDHYGVKAKDEATVHELIAKVKALGINHIVVPSPLCLSVYIEDPDGDLFEVGYPPPGAEFALLQDNAGEVLQKWLEKQGTSQKTVPRPPAVGGALQFSNASS